MIHYPEAAWCNQEDIIPYVYARWNRFVTYPRVWWVWQWKTWAPRCQFPEFSSRLLRCLALVRLPQRHRRPVSGTSNHNHPLQAPPPPVHCSASFVYFLILRICFCTFTKVKFSLGLSIKIPVTTATDRLKYGWCTSPIWISWKD